MLSVTVSIVLDIGYQEDVCMAARGYISGNRLRLMFKSGAITDVHVNNVSAAASKEAA